MHFKGYTGSSCNMDIQECASNPCLNNGVCSEPFLNMYICSCQLGYTGIHCEIPIRVCDSQPCLNGGICTQFGPYSFQCSCPNGFIGKL